MEQEGIFLGKDYTVFYLHGKAEAVDRGDGFHGRNGLFVCKAFAEFHAREATRFDVFQDEDGFGWRRFGFGASGTVVGVVAFGYR